MDELKPCPFCGGQPERVYKSTGQTTHIECTGCKAQFPKSTMTNRYDDAWNTRAERTCELGIKETKFENGTFETYVCTACGYEPFRQYLFDNGDFIVQPRPSYCPNCGAKVVDA